jgi:hypothetical protein
MTPNAITVLFKEAWGAFPPLNGKPMDDNLLSIRETLLPILMEIPYHQLGRVHSLTSLITKDVRYATEHGGNSFKQPVRLPLYNTSIKDDATKVVRVRAEAAHKACLDNYASFEAAKRGAAKFLCEVVDKIWYNDLKDADTFYTKVTALEIISFLDASSEGLHAIAMISLRTNMHQYYVQADGIPQYIIMLEDAQKKAKRAGMPIADVELVMMASAAVLAVQHFPREVDDWEGLPTPNHTWLAWKTAFRLAHLKRQRQILALGGGRTTWRGSRHAPCGGVGDWTVGDGTRQPHTCGNEQHCHSPAAHIGQSGTHGHHRHTHSNQQKNGGCGGMGQGDSNCGDSSSAAGGKGSNSAALWELLLDAWPSHQQGSHKCHLRQESKGTPL